MRLILPKHHTVHGTMPELHESEKLSRVLGTAVVESVRTGTWWYGASVQLDLMLNSVHELLYSSSCILLKLCDRYYEQTVAYRSHSYRVLCCTHLPCGV